MNQTYAACLIVAGVLALTVAGFVRRRRSAPGGNALFLMLVSLTVWDWTYAGYWLTASPYGKLLWVDLAYIGVVISTPAFLVMALEFTGRRGWLTRQVYGLLAAMSILTLLMVWTDPLHHLFFGGIDIADLKSLSVVGPWFWFHVVYSHLIILVGMTIIIFDLVRSRGQYRSQLRILLIGIILPWAVNLMGFSQTALFSDIDLTPIVLAITGVAFAYGIHGLGLTDLAHISRDTLVEQMEEGILVVDQQGRVVDINARALEMAVPMDNPIGKPAQQVFAHWEDLTQHFDLPEARLLVKLEQSTTRFFDLRILPLKGREEQILGRLITWRDVTEEKKAEAVTRIFRLAVEQNPSMIVITDIEGRIEYVNEQFTRLTGYSLDDVRGKTPRVLRSGETPDELYEDLWNTIKRGDTWEFEILNRKKNGELYWAHQLIAPVLGADGTVTHFIAMQQDITERKHTESELLVANTRLQFQLEEIERLHSQLREESIRDGLTRLFNRRYMEETLEREFSRADRDPAPIRVVMMDVDLFKSINDTYGHQAGDTVLQMLGALLLENTRISDIACRYGGDEMVVVMPGASMEDAIRRAEEWRAAFSLLEFTLRDHLVRTSLSLGVASFPEHARSPIELLVASDKALYKAKNIRNTVAPYDPASMANSNNMSGDIR